MTNYPPPDPGQWSTEGSQGGYPPSGPPGKTKFAGLDPNVAAMICYLPICLNFIVATIFFVTERDLRFVRFHAAQSLLLVGAFIILLAILSTAGRVPVLGFIVHPVVIFLAPLALAVLYIFLAMRAYGGAWYKLPVLGDFAERFTS